MPSFEDMIPKWVCLDLLLVDGRLLMMLSDCQLSSRQQPICSLTWPWAKTSEGTPPSTCSRSKTCLLGMQMHVS